MADYLTPEQREPKVLWSGVKYDVDADALRASHAEADRVIELLADALRDVLDLAPDETSTDDAWHARRYANTALAEAAKLTGGAS